MDEEEEDEEDEEDEDDEDDADDDADEEEEVLFAWRVRCFFVGFRLLLSFTTPERFIFVNE